MKPLLVYDGDCGFCRFWVTRWREKIGDRIDYVTFQESAERHPEIGADASSRSSLLVDEDGSIRAGALGVFRALAHAPSGGRLLWAYRNIPGVAVLAEWIYRFVARHRRPLSLITRVLWGAHAVRPTYAISRCLLIRAIGLVYLIAFLSLWAQIAGLVGSRGILPAQPYLDAVRAQTGLERYWLLPTLCWVDAGDGFLKGLCAGGAVLSSALIAGLVPVPCLLLPWIFYLSLTTVCRTFLGFQWDALLLEAGFLTILIAPLRWRCRIPCARRPSRAFMWLLRWLLFRLMFSSGVVKLASGDPSWNSLTALDFHYETQPLPTWTAWYAHQLPGAFQRTSVILMFVVELLVPFLIFGPRRMKLLACALLVSLQVMFAGTGNYAFFNLLTIALCLSLVDDAAWPKRWRAEPPAPLRSRRRGWIVIPIVAVLMVASTTEMAARFGTPLPWPAFVARGIDLLSPFRLVNAYGLFAVMTTRRAEIVVEGSNDGSTWLAYEFKWKPGDPTRRPGFVAPHQPRLDWQMWFAALGPYNQSPWLRGFEARLLQGSPEVLALLGHNPFPDAPPRYIRAVLYDYHFTDPATRRAGGAWWRRELLGAFGPQFRSFGDSNRNR